jgi:hypothetical protein
MPGHRVALQPFARISASAQADLDREAADVERFLNVTSLGE